MCTRKHFQIRSLSLNSFFVANKEAFLTVKTSTDKRRAAAYTGWLAGYIASSRAVVVYTYWLAKLYYCVIRTHVCMYVCVAYRLLAGIALRKVVAMKLHPSIEVRK